MCKTYRFRLRIEERVQGVIAVGTAIKYGHLQVLSYCQKKNKEKKEKSTQAVKTTPHINQGKGATLVPSTVKLLHHEKERKNQLGSEGWQAWPETGS